MATPRLHHIWFRR